MSEESTITEDRPKRGLARLPPEQRSAIAAEGGRAAHRAGRGHEWTSEEAREAGRLGGKRAHESGKGHRFTSELARIAGAKGGSARGKGKKTEGPQD